MIREGAVAGRSRSRRGGRRIWEGRRDGRWARSTGVWTGGSAAYAAAVGKPAFQPAGWTFDLLASRHPKPSANLRRCVACPLPFLIDNPALERALRIRHSAYFVCTCPLTPEHIRCMIAASFASLGRHHPTTVASSFCCPSCSAISVCLSAALIFAASMPSSPDSFFCVFISCSTRVRHTLASHMLIFQDNNI